MRWLVFASSGLGGEVKGRTCCMMMTATMMMMTRFEWMEASRPDDDPSWLIRPQNRLLFRVFDDLTNGLAWPVRCRYIWGSLALCKECFSSKSKESELTTNYSSSKIKHKFASNSQKDLYCVSDKKHFFGRCVSIRWCIFFWWSCPFPTQRFSHPENVLGLRVKDYQIGNLFPSRPFLPQHIPPLVSTTLIHLGSESEISTRKWKWKRTISETQFHQDHFFHSTSLLKFHQN